MVQLWKVFAEITVKSGHFEFGHTAGFMNSDTWAASADESRAKIEAYFRDLQLACRGIRGGFADPGYFFADSEGFQDMVDRAMTNPDAIILGTFHSFKVN